MNENNTLVRKCDLPEYSIVDGLGIHYGTHARWEDAQEQASAAVNHIMSGELFIMRGEDMLEIVQVGRKVLSLKIAGPERRCEWCNAMTDVVVCPDGAICQDCSGEFGYGEHMWSYLQS